MQRRTLITLLASLTGGAVLPTWAQVGSKDEAPDALIKRLSTDLLELVKKDPALKKGDLARISEVVDREVIPYVNFRKMTSAAVGPQWRQASDAVPRRRVSARGHDQLPGPPGLEPWR